MNNTGKNHLQFGDNHILWLVGESSINDRVFYSMVYREVKSKKYIDTTKKVLPFFLGYNGYNGYTNKNNELTPVFVTGCNQCNQNVLVTPFKTKKYSCQPINYKQCYKHKIPP
jgi:hypothetical protein